ncbi:Ribosomal silencing factor RsfS [Candidatus Bealeia paramacronuclearis]|uniref:Ribosomal silencing factor RsfS n=1 Tax=Candidatus Bealeia paramacronuclearis TaxID=1921001 RepID=A0ABZ2C5M9_9PROT|nr:Ribosomal silencing factor RsfS [Candidatus Bealeia paramacronuclearis]
MNHTIYNFIGAIISKAVPNPQELKAEILKFLEDHKALDIFTIDIKDRSSFADYLIIASGTSQRQISSTAELLRQHLKEMGITPIYIEGVPQCDWVLIDAGDIIVHLFRPEVREFYNIEKMWDIVESHLESRNA